MANERWKPIDGYPNYSISDHGRVRSIARGTPREMKTKEDRYGYPKVTIRSNGTSSTVNVHQLVARAFVNGHDETMQVNHINGDKHDNRASNLEWVTVGDNLRHAYKTGLNVGPRKAVRIIETGDIYASEKECAASIGGILSGVSNCLQGRRNTYKGFHYEFVDESE